MVKYEAMIIVKPELTEEQRKVLFNQIHEAVTKNQGTVDNGAVWSERKRFLFPINKCHEGVYYLLSFSAPGAAIKEMRHAYKLNENILRVLFSKL